MSKRKGWKEEKKEKGKSQEMRGSHREGVGRWQDEWAARAEQCGANSALHECTAKFRGEQFDQQHFTIQVILITAGARWAGNSNKKTVLLKKKSSSLFENTVHTRPLRP